MENLLWRLEQVVGKLEHFTSRWCLDGNGYPSSVDVMPPNSREEMASRNTFPSGLVDRAAGGTASWNVAYDQLMSGPLLSYLKASQRIGDDVLMQASLVEGAFVAQRQYLMAVSRQPSLPLDVENLYRTMAEKLIQVQEFRDAKRGTIYFNHLSTIAESIPALGWVTMNAEGGMHIRSVIDAGQFFANRVLLEFKEKDPVHVDWVNAWFDTLTQLLSYASEFHPTGVRLHSLKGNEHLSAFATPLNAADQLSTPIPLAPSLHPSESAVLPTPKSVVSDRGNLRKRQSNPETNSNQRHELEEILRQMTHGMQDLKKSVYSTEKAKSAKPSIPEPYLSSTKSDEQEPNKHFFTKLKPTGLKLTNQPSETQSRSNASCAAKQDSHFIAAFPGFNANCSHRTNPDHPTTISQQFQPASKGNSYSGNSDLQWLSSKSPSQLTSSNPTNPLSQLNESYPGSTPSQFNPSAPATPPSRLSLSLQANNRLSKFNASNPTKAPSQFSSSSPTIPPSQSSPACLASPLSEFNPSCHSKSSITSKALHIVQSLHDSVTPRPPSDSPSAARTTRSEPKNKPDKAPLCILNGKKWIVEHYRDVKDLVISVADIHESVYVFDCNDCIIRVNGKTSAITIDNCKGTGLIFDETVSALEIVNCQRIQAQALVKVPAVSVDKTDGCTVFLSLESLNARIITSKSSAVNVLYPDEHGEFREYPIPEQFCSQWNGDHLVTDLSDTRRHA